MVKYILFVVGMLLAAPLQAQTARDSLIANKIRFAKDSAYCTTAAQYRDRCVRAKIVLDSIMTSLRCGRAIIRDTNSITFPWKCAPLEPGFDSTTSVTIVMPKDSLVVGEEQIVCAYFTTKTGLRGLMSPVTILASQDTTFAKLRENMDPGGTEQCRDLIASRGVVLTPGLTRPGSLTLTRIP